MNLQPDNEFAAFIGIDWADAKHDICLQAADSGKRALAILAHCPKAIDEWACALRQRFYGKPVAVCLEIARGPLVYALQKYDFLVLFPVNPATLAKYRQAFKPSHAKADPTDAEIALEILLGHRDKLKALKPQSAGMRTLECLLEERARLVGDQTRITNRLESALKHYFPQVVDWFEEKASVMFCDFLTRWPTLNDVQQARRATLEAFFREHHSRSSTLLEARLAAIKSATPLTEDPAVIKPKQLLVEALVQQLRPTLKAIARFDAQISALSRSLPDYALFSGLPGAGLVLAPRLLAAFGEQRDRYESATEMQRYVGIAPVTESSGKKHWVHWRLQCPKFLRQTFVEWAAQTIPRSFWAGAYYRQQRAKGCSHQVAVRALAFKWIRILYRCWQDRTPYDESKYLNALKRRGSPLLATMGQTSPLASA
ncbi:MAG: IS110 family transposase [Candidatus Methylophosphatis roskildensis]